MLRAHDLGIRDVMQHTRTFGAEASRPGPRPPRGMNPDPGTRRERGDDESPKCGQGSPEDPGTCLGASVPRACVAVRDGLHVPQGTEEGPAEAGPPVLLPDAGREGQPRVRRAGRRHPRQHVPPGAGAVAGMAEAVPVHHPVAGDLSGARDAAAVPHGPQPGAAQRPGDPDDRRGTSLDDPAEPQAPVHEQLHRPGRLQQQPPQLPERLLRDHRPAVRRGLHHR